jgi:ribosome biogenesis GTPase
MLRCYILQVLTINADAIDERTGAEHRGNPQASGSLMAGRRLTRKQREQIKKTQEQRRARVGERADAQFDLRAQRGTLGAEQPGLVIANYGQTLIIEDGKGALFRCAVRQNLGALACGDRVVWQTSGHQEGVVVVAEERRSVLTRPDYSGRSKPVAANLDQVAVVVAPRPDLSESLIDRYLVATALIGVPPLLALNKIDLLDPAELQVIAKRLSGYRRIGYPVLFASTRSAHGLDQLKQRLRNRTSILVGQSGVGKSSLIRALLPDRDIRIQALSETTGLGIHTTTTSMLYHLPDGGDLIDSPGVRSFELTDVSPDKLEQGFVEFDPYRGHCRFSNCSHTVEPGCALLAAVKSGEIQERRLASYQQIKNSLTNP